MTSDPPLAGLSVLVVEDQFLLAADISFSLEEAGARVLCCHNLQAALQQLGKERFDFALVDINLGDGPDFSIARRLEALKAPFAFLTGYDAGVIPPDLRDRPRVEKSGDPEELVAAVRDACATRGDPSPDAG